MANETTNNATETTETTVVEETTTETKPTVTTAEPKETELAETQPIEQPQENIPETTIPTENKNEPTEEQTPETKESPKAFDIDYWLNYAKNYAQSKGLVLDAAAVDCWDNPIRAGSHCVYLERDIQSRLNRYANDEDITDVWIWAESVGNDCYDIYIGYA